MQDAEWVFVVMLKAGADMYCKEYASFFLLNSRFCVL